MMVHSSRNSWFNYTEDLQGLTHMEGVSHMDWLGH